MKQIWHIVRKDARRLWLPLALWLMLVTLGHGIEWRAQHVLTDDRMWTQRMKLFASVIWLLQIFVGYVLAAALVMEDPPADTGAFWLTRPMSGARVLGAKVLGCLVLLMALPLIAALPWWLLGGDGAEKIFGLTRETFRWQAWTGGLGLAVATFTRGGGQFLGGTLIVQGAILAAGIAWDKSGFTSANLAAAAGQIHLAELVAVAGIAIAMLVRYHARRTRVAWIVMAASAAGALVIGFTALA